MRHFTPRIRRSFAFCLASTIVLILTGSTCATALPALDNELKAAVVEKVSQKLNRTYVLPELAARMAGLIQANLQTGEYDGITTIPEFAERLTRDLRGISHDPHLGVEVIGGANRNSPTPEIDGHDPELLRRQNYGFGKVQVLGGNVGYLQLNGFASALQAGSTAVAAMNLLASADALIIDLRDNGGGGPSGIQLIFSYLLAEPTQLSGIYIRESDTHIQLWTHAHVSGPRMTDIPVYVLVSNRTFSAAEAFAYDMKQLERGTIIGETTRGGAHLVRDVDYPELYITVRVPFGRAISPVTGANWEGTGVEPDIPVPADEALAVAHAEAMRTILERETDKRWRQWLENALREVEGQRD